MKTYVTLVYVSAVFVCFANSNVTAQLITPVSQARSISANAGGVTASTNAPDFRPFNASVSESANSFANASQNSQINGSSILASGGVSYSFPGNGSGGSAGADSEFSVTFTIAAPSSYTLAMSFSFPYGGGGGVQSLSGTGGTIYQVLGPNGSGSTSGVLSPGQYVVSVDCETAHAVDSGQGSFSLDLELVPEPSTLAMVTLGLGVVLGARQFRRRSPRSANSEIGAAGKPQLR
jgi:hypothetical protein